MAEEQGNSGVTITCAENGPYIVAGLEQLTGSDGKAVPVKGKIALCRCGASNKKPYCDGTHAKIGFKAD